MLTKVFDCVETLHNSWIITLRTYYKIIEMDKTHVVIKPEEEYHIEIQHPIPINNDYYINMEMFDVILKEQISDKGVVYFKWLTLKERG